MAIGRRSEVSLVAFGYSFHDLGWSAVECRKVEPPFDLRRLHIALVSKMLERSRVLGVKRRNTTSVR